MYFKIQERLESLGLVYYKQPWQSSTKKVWNSNCILFDDVLTKPPFAPSKSCICGVFKTRIDKPENYKKRVNFFWDSLHAGIEIR